MAGIPVGGYFHAGSDLPTAVCKVAAAGVLSMSSWPPAPNGRTDPSLMSRREASVLRRLERC